jgi:hypothetical protein
MIASIAQHDDFVARQEAQPAIGAHARGPSLLRLRHALGDRGG